MIATDAVAVAITAGDDYLELMVGERGASGHREGASVQRVHAVGIDVAG